MSKPLQPDHQKKKRLESFVLLRAAAQVIGVDFVPRPQCTCTRSFTHKGKESWQRERYLRKKAAEYFQEKW